VLPDSTGDRTVEIDVEWTEVVEHAMRLGPDVFMATVTPRCEPHVAVVSPGFVDDLVVVATSVSSAKATNLRAHPGVFFHWPVREESGNDMLVVRGDARLVDDLDRSRRLWDSHCLPYDPGDWYRDPGDPSLLWVEIDPIYASLHRDFGNGGSSIWRGSKPRPREG
jgi:general stress protein 26